MVAGARYSMLNGGLISNIQHSTSFILLKTRIALRTRAATLDSARSDFENAIDDIRQTFRAEPYSPDATRSATATARVARQRFEQLLHEVVVSSAAKMSPAGRLKLSEFGPPLTTPAPKR